jgi:hypothetical protein
VFVFGEQKVPEIVYCPVRSTEPPTGDEKLADVLEDVRETKSIKPVLFVHFGAIQLIPFVETDTGIS